MNEKLLKKLRKAIKTARAEDQFEVGTVIRWTASGRFTYAAIRTAVGWASTSRAGNPFVPQLLEYEELVEILGRTETTDVAIAAEWEALR